MHRMNGETGAVIDKVRRDPEFKALVHDRSRLAWGLSLTMTTIYFGFILLIAFAPDLLGIPIGNGVMTIGIPLGVGVILAAFVLTGVYVWQANFVFDPKIRAIIERSR